VVARDAFNEARERWLAADAVILLRSGFTVRLARSIGGAPKRFVSGRLVAA